LETLEKYRMARLLKAPERVAVRKIIEEILLRENEPVLRKNARELK